MARIAIAHERWTDVAGSEQVTQQLTKTWSETSVHVPFAKKSLIPEDLRDSFHISPLQVAYQLIRQRTYAPLLPLVPPAMQWGSLRQAHDVDAVVVSHHAFALAAVGAAQAINKPSVAYVHSPARWAWDARFRQEENRSKAGKAALAVLSARARANETRWAPHVTSIVGNSSAVVKRIEQHWNREAQVVHPPVDTEFFHPDEAIEKGDYFISVGRLVPYKQVPLGVAAAVAAGVRLVVVGDGRDMDRARAFAGPNVEFKGRLPGDEMRDLIRGARALLMPGEEDFGIVPVEAMACGTPVIALGKGGALDTVKPGISGELFSGDVEKEVIANLAEVLKNFDDSRFNISTLRNWAEGFSEASFREKMAEVVDAVV